MSDYVDEVTHELNKLRLSKKKPRSCLNMMKDSKHLMKMLLMKRMSGMNGFSKSLKRFSLSEVCAMYSGVVKLTAYVLYVKMKKLVKMKKQVKMMKLMIMRFRDVAGSWEN
jgi:hypothetical protein